MTPDNHMAQLYVVAERAERRGDYQAALLATQQVLQLALAALDDKRTVEASRVAIIAGDLRAKGAKPREVDGVWHVHVTVELFGDDEHDTRGTTRLLTTYSGTGESRAAAITDVASVLDGTGIVEVYDGRAHWVRGVLLEAE